MAPELRGHGGTTLPDEHNLALGTLVEDAVEAVAAVLERVKGGRHATELLLVGAVALPCAPP